ncbi:MAG: thioredoxin family protein [Candidatus Berkelbacteria bacterium]|nr:thioredoxin family protein [Candidatus Berkelbacteria bacterium]
MSKTLREFEDSEFNDLIKSKKNAIIEFGAPWCNACKLTEPIIANLEESYQNVLFGKIDVAKAPGLASKMGVMSLPNIFIIKAGKIADQIIGVTNKKTLEEKIKKLKC